MNMLHELNFDEFYTRYKEGALQSVTRTVEVTQEMHDAFKRISGSTALIHENPEYACSLGYPSNLSYGLLYAIVSVAASEVLTGENVVGYEWDVVFRKSIFVGDILNITCTVDSMSKSIKSMVEKITVSDTKGNARSTIYVKLKFLK